MADKQEKINQLSEQLGQLLKKQDAFAIEINELRKQLQQIRFDEAHKTEKEIKITAPTPPPTEENIVAEIKEEVVLTPKQEAPQKVDQLLTEKPKERVVPKKKTKSGLEKFIGENLINKIGIIITIIGVGIGAKYSIDNNLISPLTRMILGYLTGLGLLGFGIKLKAKYENYSAVLVSGAIAIMYFITFAAYSFYELMPQTVAFALMVIFTIFTVIAALNYNRQIIAIIGLVGAYGVPFLLSDGSGKIEVMFTYMAIINTGILIIAFKKYWKILYYTAFALTWLIFLSFTVFSYDHEQHFNIAMIFLTVFFLIFYVTFIAYKLLKKESFGVLDILLLVANSFIFYGMGYVLISNHENGDQFLGLFTLGNAIVHFIVSVLFFKQKLADRNLFFLVAGLVLVFITIAIPVQLDGNWVTLLWAGEAALLFWIGRTKNVPIYEKMAYPLIILAFFSLFHDWASPAFEYVPEEERTLISPFLHKGFLTGLVVAASLGFITYLSSSKKFALNETNKNVFATIFSVFTPILLCLVLYITFALEINTYWEQLYKASELKLQDGDSGHTTWQHNYDLPTFKSIWLVNYTLLFVSLLSFINIAKIKNRILGIVNLVLNVFAILIFLTAGLYALSELRESYLDKTLAEFYNIGFFHIGIRYVSFAFLGLVLWAIYKYRKAAFMRINFKIPFELILHTALIWVLSSELLNWMDLGGSEQSYKLGLSIFWGSYALLLIALGIWKKKQYLRIGAIVLFGITLVKLFMYDISDLNTISKTIVFVALGVLLLIISFLYNKYKHIIADDDPKN